MEEFEKVLEMDLSKQTTPTEVENKLIAKELDQALKDKLRKYYALQGRENYTFSLKEEVVKIAEMTG